MSNLSRYNINPMGHIIQCSIYLQEFYFPISLIIMVKLLQQNFLEENRRFQLLICDWLQSFLHLLLKPKLIFHLPQNIIEIIYIYIVTLISGHRYYLALALQIQNSKSLWTTVQNSGGKGDIAQLPPTPPVCLQQYFNVLLWFFL